VSYEGLSGQCDDIGGDYQVVGERWPDRETGGPAHIQKALGVGVLREKVDFVRIVLDQSSQVLEVQNIRSTMPPRVVYTAVRHGVQCVDGWWTFTWSSEGGGTGGQDRTTSVRFLRLTPSRALIGHSITDAANGLMPSYRFHYEEWSKFERHRND
jgi:hypothetical protein